MAGSWLINGGDPNHLLTRMIFEVSGGISSCGWPPFFLGVPNTFGVSRHSPNICKQPGRFRRIQEDRRFFVTKLLHGTLG